MTCRLRWQAVAIVADDRTRYPLTVGTYALWAEAAAAAAKAAGAGEWHVTPCAVEVTP